MAQDTYFGDFNSAREAPNRTITGVQFNPVKPFRPEGIVLLRIVHVFPAIAQSGEREGVRLAAKNDLVESTWLAMSMGDAQNYNLAADAITQAGRMLAVDASAGSDPKQVLAAEQNADMLAFRCDWIEQSSPFFRRGQNEDNLWTEILEYRAFVSAATA